LVGKRRCERCSGYLLHNADSFGTYFSCLCCGALIDEVIAVVPGVWLEAEAWLRPNSHDIPRTDWRASTHGLVPKRHGAE